MTSTTTKTNFIIGLLIIMGIFSFLKPKEAKAASNPLTWFELQISKSVYRFAITPEQPILIGDDGTEGGIDATIFIRTENTPELYAKIVEQVSEIVKNSNVISLPLSNPGKAFAAEAMIDSSVHIRIAFADNTRWAGLYDLTTSPMEVTSLLQETKKLALQIKNDQEHTLIDGDKAKSYVDPTKTQDETTQPIVKVGILKSGKITVNSKEVTIAELEATLDNLKQQNGDVWYSREDPENDPSELVDAVIKEVLDAIISRELAVKLQPE